MTRHKALHTGLVSPSPLDRLINALLHAFAMLVSYVAHLCSMRLIRLSAACHSDATPEALPCTESGKLKETTKAAGSSYTRRAGASSSNALAAAAESAGDRETLMVSSSRPSNHEGGLTSLSTSHPRACSEDLVLAAEELVPIPNDLPTEILGMRFASPRMTRGWVCWENTQARALN